MFRPARVRKMLAMKDRLLETAQFPKAAKHQWSHSPDDGIPCLDAPRGNDPSTIRGTPEVLIGAKVDLDRALRAGCRTVEEVAAFLCPFGIDDGTPSR